MQKIGLQPPLCCLATAKKNVQNRYYTANPKTLNFRAQKHVLSIFDLDPSFYMTAEMFQLRITSVAATGGVEPNITITTIIFSLQAV